MAVPPTQPNPNNNNVANRAVPQGLPILPRAPNPNTGIMAAPGGYPRVLNGGAFTQYLGGGQQQLVLHQPPPPQLTQATAADDSDEDDDEDVFSPIIITIVNPLYIKGDENVVTLDPSLMSQRIATSIALSLNKIAGEVPMIDENGVPREIRVIVNAETKIEGNKNLIGERLGGSVETKLEDVAALAVMTNGTATNGVDGHAHGGGKRKAVTINHEEQDVAPSGLGINMQPDGGDAEDHFVKRARLE